MIWPDPAVSEAVDGGALSIGAGVAADHDPAVTHDGGAAPGSLLPVEVAPAIPVAVSVDALIDILKEDSDRTEQIGLRVVGPRQGRRRAGRAFGPEAQIIPAINLGEDELRAIDGDPLLTWSIVPIEAKEDGEAQ